MIVKSYSGKGGGNYTWIDGEFQQRNGNYKKEMLELNP